MAGTVDEFVAHLRACAEITPWPGVRDCYIRAAGIIEGDRAALRRLHDECCIYGNPQKRLNAGPMLEPSEGAVLEARKRLEV